MAGEIHLTDEPIDRQALIDDVIRASDGALALFEGIVRDHHAGRAVTEILYEAYRPMAEKEMARIVAEVSKRYPDARVRAMHRLGLLRVGEASIVIAASSPHRADAFDACRDVIERVKETVPIWKKERGPDGEEWVGWQGGEMGSAERESRSAERESKREERGTRSAERESKSEERESRNAERGTRDE